MTHMRKTKQSTEYESCKDNSTLRKKVENKRVKTKSDNKNEPIIIIKDKKTREEGEERVR